MSSANSHLTGPVPEASEDDANAAVAAAKAAFPAWSKLPGAERAGYVRKLAALLRQHSDELAVLDAIAMGKPISTYADAVRGAAAMETIAGEWIHLQGQSTIANPGDPGITIRQPFGVAAIIIPWNHPITFMVNKAAAALMAGNTVVLKSSEKAPLTPCRTAELIQKQAFRRASMLYQGMVHRLVPFLLRIWMSASSASPGPAEPAASSSRKLQSPI